MSHILFREAAEHRRDSLHVAYSGQMTISDPEWGWAISLLRVFWGSNEITELRLSSNLKDHLSKGNSIKQCKEMYKQKTLLKNIDGNFYSYIHFIIELFFMLLVVVASDSKLWVRAQWMCSWKWLLGHQRLTLGSLDECISGSPKPLFWRASWLIWTILLRGQPNLEPWRTSPWPRCGWGLREEFHL